MFKWFRSHNPNQKGHISEVVTSPGGDDPIKWIRKVAEKGTTWGQYNLAIRYVHGDGIAQDYSEAIKWFQKAADQNDAMSQYWLGEMYEKGLGVPVDQILAYKWYSMAARQGIREAETAQRHLQRSLTSEQLADGQAHPLPPAPKKAA
jgi:TPR repeat protein